MLTDYQCATQNCFTEEENVRSSSLRYIIEGAQSFSAENRSVSLMPNSILFVQGGTKLRLLKGRLVKGRTLFVKPSIDLDISRTLGVGVLPVCGDERIQMIALLHQRGWMSDDQTRIKLTMILDRYIRSQVVSLDKLTHRSKETRMESLYRLTLARQYLDINMAKHVAIDHLTHVSFLSKFELIRRFKEAFNETPYRYYLTRKIAATKADLLKGMSLLEIVSKYEFADTFSYSKLFKTTLGVSPSTYRKSMQVKIQQLSDQAQYGAPDFSSGSRLLE